MTKTCEEYVLNELRFAKEKISRLEKDSIQQSKIIFEERSEKTKAINEIIKLKEEIVSLKELIKKQDLIIVEFNKKEREKNEYSS